MTLLLYLSCAIQAEESSPLAIGNLALPPSQQPRLLFCFGQNIVDRHDVIGYDNLFVRKFQKDHFLANDIGLLYAPSDRSSIIGSVLAPVDYKTGKKRSTGIGDTMITGEYAYLQKEYETSVTLATVVGSVTFPTGSAKKDPPTGFGSMSYFIGGTLFNLSIDWYIYSSLGNLFITKHNGSKFGDILSYQTGIGRNLKHMKDRILILFLEFNGFREKRDLEKNRVVPNSGSNTMFLGPSIFYATPRWTCAVGIQAPIYEKLCGNQPKSSWFFGFRFAWLFHHEPSGHIFK